MGNLVADLFADPIPRLPNPGELAITSGLVMSVGGSAANTAVVLRTLGRDVGVAGKVGADLQGDFILSELRRRGVHVRHILRTKDRPTSTTVILNVTGEDRRYLHSIGSNAEFELDDFDLDSLAGCRVLYFGGYLALPSFKPLDLRKLFHNAKARGITTVLDVAMPAGALFGIDDIEPALPYVDYFLPNDEEAGRLTGETDERQQAKRLGDLNPECAVVITRGSRGSLARLHNRFIETPPFPMWSVDESGAGDAFTAGLITAVLKNWDLELALVFASAVGASCTRALGCFTSVFTFEEAITFLEAETITVLPGATLS